MRTGRGDGRIRVQFAAAIATLALLAGLMPVSVVLAAPLFVMLKKNPELIGLEQRL